LPDTLNDEQSTVGFGKNDIVLRDKIDSVLSDIISDGIIVGIADNLPVSDAMLIH
jgi:hypothetical protein